MKYKSNQVMRLLGLTSVLCGFTLLPQACTKKDTVPQTVRVEDIKDNPAAFMGKTVTVSGEIERVYGPRAFQLGGTDFFDSEIRVLTTEPLKESVRRRAEEPFTVDDIALVTGTVRNVVVADVEREFSFDLDPNYEVEFENKMAIIATSVLISPRGQGTSVATTGSTATTPSTTQSDLQMILNTADKASLVGTQVDLKGVTVQNVTGDQSFWIGPNASQMIFVTFAEIPKPGQAKEGQVAIKAGQKVSLNGVIRSLPTISDEWLQQNKMDSKSAETLRQHTIYIQSSEVKIDGAAG